MSEIHQTVGTYLIQRIYDHGVRYVFGVPGDYVLGFYQELNNSNKLKIINTCDEQGAEFCSRCIRSYQWIRCRMCDILCRWVESC